MTIIYLKRCSEFDEFHLDCAEFFSGVGLFERTLKELYVDGLCNENLSFSLLLDSLPALTHLTITLKHGREYASNIEVLRQNVQPNNNDNNYNLIFLSLNSDIRCCYDVEEIIKRCPRLEYLMVLDRTIYKPHEATAMEFTYFLEQCPSISYIHWGEDIISSKTEKEWLTLSQRKRNIDTEDNSNDYEKKKSKQPTPSSIL